MMCPKCNAEVPDDQMEEHKKMCGNEAGSEGSDSGDSENTEENTEENKEQQM